MSDPTDEEKAKAIDLWSKRWPDERDQRASVREANDWRDEWMPLANALAEARVKALEEAARVCADAARQVRGALGQSHTTLTESATYDDAAERIRALKGTP